ncbi:component of SufBCD complex [Loktanella agnita]|uniref:component of SufBCD complex n=1 Tax=Loktanella agnita TaxID=287097 RepID=UPI00398A17E1
MHWNNAVFHVIDLRTFSNIWYWLAVGVTWSVLSHWIIGVPFDMIYRARKEGGAAAHDLDQLVAINVRRLMQLSHIAGLWLSAFVAFILSSIAMMAFYYGSELAQGILLLMLPVTIVAVMNLRKSHQYELKQPTGKVLIKELLHLRLIIQSIGVVAIFFTAMYGMYFNLSVPVGY